MFIKDEMSRSDMVMMIVASVALTVPFIFYAKDIAESLRRISDK